MILQEFEVEFGGSTLTPAMRTEFLSCSMAITHLSQSGVEG